MATRMFAPSCRADNDGSTNEPSWSAILAAVALALAFVLLTRWPVARTQPMESDEFGFLQDIAGRWFPMHHTLFKTLARGIGLIGNDAYRGFIVLDMIASALAMVSVWWWLRALVRPSVAAAAALLLGVGPVFWGYGAIAGNYTAIVVVGSFLLGVAIRGHRRPEAWQPLAAATLLAVGTGYRPDIGVLWLPVFLVILWQHRWRRAVLAGIAFAALNLAWAVPMIVDAGGWENYRAASARFAHETGARNSYWHLGLVDGPMRYSVKLAMALLWTLGPALLFVPRGGLRLWRLESGHFLALLLVLSIVPALAFHLLIHFGVPGYCFHYLPSVMALVVLGIGHDHGLASVPANGSRPSPGDRATPRLIGLAAILAGVFWFYPTDFSAPGWRGDFDLAFCRLTRKGLNTPAPRPGPRLWRTANSTKPTELPNHDRSPSGFLTAETRE